MKKIPAQTPRPASGKASTDEARARRLDREYDTPTGSREEAPSQQTNIPRRPR